MLFNIDILLEIIHSKLKSYEKSDDSTETKSLKVKIRVASEYISRHDN
jgi:hypothetical protein